MKKLAPLVALVLILGSTEQSWGEHGTPGAEQFHILGIRIGVDNYESLQSKLGAVAKCRTPEHITTSGYKNSKEEVVFEFSEVGGGDITGFYVRPSTEILHEECPRSALPAGLSEIATGGGVQIGMNERNFFVAFGIPRGRSVGTDWKHHWEWESDLTDAERQVFKNARPGAVAPTRKDVSIWVEARFARNRLSYFHISKVETL
jgi:hypothetical protein